VLTTVDREEIAKVRILDWEELAVAAIVELVSRDGCGSRMVSL
jgi:hypothetical protein